MNSSSSSSNKNDESSLPSLPAFLPPPLLIQAAAAKDSLVKTITSNHYYRHYYAKKRKRLFWAGMAFFILLMTTQVRIVRHSSTLLLATHEQPEDEHDSATTTTSRQLLVEGAPNSNNNNNNHNKNQQLLLRSVLRELRSSTHKSGRPEEPSHRQVVSFLVEQVQRQILVTSNNMMMSQNRTTRDDQQEVLLASLHQELISLEATIVQALDNATTTTTTTQEAAAAVETTPCSPSSAATTGSSSSSLEALWQEISRPITITNNNPDGDTTFQRTRVLAHVVQRERPVALDEITMVTHLSANQMDKLLPLLQHFWGGPMSVAVWIKTEQDIQDFKAFVEKTQQTDNNNDIYESPSSYYTALRQEASYHVYMEYQPEKLYPHNKLRNIAMNYMDTDYFLTNDADIVTKPNTYPELMSLMRQYRTSITTSSSSNLNLKEQLQQKSVFVMPVFERFLPTDDETITSITQAMLPHSKQQLMEMKDKNELDIFYKAYKNIQGPTHYEIWFENATDIYYPILYKNGFEPYIVGYKHGAPQYWEFFRGFGYNKQSWFMEAAKAGYNFFVLRDFFMVHRNHKSIRKTSKEKRRNNPHMKAFDAYLTEFYKKGNRDNNNNNKKKKKK